MESRLAAVFIPRVRLLTFLLKYPLYFVLHWNSFLLSITFDALYYCLHKRPPSLESITLSLYFFYFFIFCLYFLYRINYVIHWHCTTNSWFLASKALFLCWRGQRFWIFCTATVVSQIEWLLLPQVISKLF